MGYYTELIFGCSLKEDTPRNVIKTLEYMMDKSDFKSIDKSVALYHYTLPDHEFFNHRRWEHMFNASSQMFGVNEAISEMWHSTITKCYHISTRSSIKNYENEIELFLDWIKPYIRYGSGAHNLYAIVTYESGEPVFYYNGNDEE
jgi:hypothetical protein